MKYATKKAAIASAQTAGSTATTWHGARRWILAHVRILPLRDAAQYRHYPWSEDGHRQDEQWKAAARKKYYRNFWITRIEARADRTAKKLGYWSMADAEILASNLTTPYLRHAEAALWVNWPYRKSQSSWAGGEHSVTVALGDPRAHGESSRAWSDNGKWSGTNSHASIYTDIPTLLEFPELMTKDGLALCHAEKIGPREYRVRWIEQSTGVSLKTVDGYLIRGYHVRAPGIQSARTKAAKAREQALSATLLARDAKRKKRVELSALKSIYLSVEDSIAAGNCKPVTEQYAAKVWDKLHASGPCAVRADVVLGDRDDYYTRRALGAAMTRG